MRRERSATTLGIWERRDPSHWTTDSGPRSHVIRGDEDGVAVRVGELECVSGMPGVGGGPASGWPFCKELFAVWAALAGDDPRGDIVGIVSGMALVVECKLLEGPVSRLEFVEFVCEFPLPITSRTRYDRRVLRIRWGLVDGHAPHLPHRST